MLISFSSASFNDSQNLKSLNFEILTRQLCQIVSDNAQKQLPEVFYEKVLLEISQNSQENTCVRVSFLIRPATLFKMRLWYRCFPVNFSKFLRTPFWQKASGRLLLNAFVFDQPNCRFDYLRTIHKLRTLNFLTPALTFVRTLAKQWRR